MYLAFLEFLGTTELVVILFAALLLFGPRRLPQMSRQLGRSLADFKRASEDFKRTWEKEVDLEKLEEEGRVARSMLSTNDSVHESNANAPVYESNAAADEPLLERGMEDGAATASQTIEPTIARENAVLAETTEAATVEAESSSPSRKRDWL